ncbi:MAG: TetR/AcrR family transcriptional regulator [Tannerellaceae bacterium]
MTVSRTREMLVDVARKLFAREGVENTTMNDIAIASGKGRRTLYTYFKSKNEIYLAVVESELKQLYTALLEVESKDLAPDKKLIELIYTRLEAVKRVVLRNGTLRADFFRDIWKVEKVRKTFDLKEIEILKRTLDEGVAKGIFFVPDTEVTAAILHHAVKGLEVPFIRGLLGDDQEMKQRRKENVINLLFNGLKIK